MRSMRLATAIVVFAALGSLASTASAALALPEFAITSDKFEAKSMAGEFKSAGTFKCTSDKIAKATGNEVTGMKTMTAKIDIEGCSILGISLNSEGDAKNVILAEVAGELCYILGSTKVAPKVGVYSKLVENVKFEGGGVKYQLTGAVIGVVTPLNKKSLTGAFTYSSPNPPECFPENENKGVPKQHSLLFKSGSGAFAKAEEQTTEEVTFEKDEEVKA
jgi:hypothetical protein